MRWEYEYVWIDAGSNQSFAKQLAERGIRGWELVAIPQTNGPSYRCVFKRPIEGE